MIMPAYACKTPNYILCNNYSNEDIATIIGDHPYCCSESFPLNSLFPNFGPFYYIFVPKI